MITKITHQVLNSIEARLVSCDHCGRELYTIEPETRTEFEPHAFVGEVKHADVTFRMMVNDNRPTARHNFQLCGECAGNALALIKEKQKQQTEKDTPHA